MEKHTPAPALELKLDQTLKLKTVVWSVAKDAPVIHITVTNITSMLEVEQCCLVFLSISFFSSMEAIEFYDLYATK